MALRGTLNHRKTRRLANLLGIDSCFALGLMEAIWNLTGDQQPDGGIGRLSDQDICDEIFYSGDSSHLIDCMVKAKLLDKTDDAHRLFVHDWHEWADNHTVSKLVQRRQRFANGEIPALTKYAVSVRDKILSDYAGDEATVREMRTNEHGAHDARSRAARPVPVPVSVPVPVPVSGNEREVVTELEEAQPLSSPATSPDPGTEPPNLNPRSFHSPIEIPRKPMEAPRPSGSGLTTERIRQMRNTLHGYLGMHGTAFERTVPPPDDPVVLRCLNAVGDAGEEEIAAFLRELFVNGNQSPRHPNGPKGYAWFPAVLSARFGRDGPAGNALRKPEPELQGART